MKKLITILLLFAVNLISQETEYWKKIDFDFDSGIKQISLYHTWPGDYSYGDLPFLVLTENDDIFYFENIEAIGINLNFPDALNIQKIMFVKDGGSESYYVMADSILYYYHHGSSDWREYALPDSIKIITDFTALPMEILYPYTFVIISEQGVPYFLDWYSWQIKCDGLNSEKILEVKYFLSRVWGLSDNNKIYSNKYSTNEWIHDGTIDSSIIVNEITHIEYLQSFYTDENNKLYYQFGHIVDSLTKVSSLLIDFPVTSFANIQTSYETTGLPSRANIIVGTDGGGIHYVNNYNNDFEIVEVGTQFLGKKITDIEVNAYKKPDLTLLGTAEGEVYWSYWDRQTNVEDENKYSRFSISPNPATDYIEIMNLSPPSPIEWDLELNIFDLLGQSVLRNTPSSLRDATTPFEGNYRLDVSHLQPGIYFVRVGSEFLKFVKM